MKKSQTLRLTPYAWAKLLFLRDIGPTEVGAFGISDKKDPLLIHDLQLVKQRTTGVTVCFDDEAVADYLDARVDEGIAPESCMRLWVHTHPGNSAQPSPTDEETFLRCFGDTDWAVMFILAQGGQTYARLRFRAGPTGEIVLPVSVCYEHDFPASNMSAWYEEYCACVEELPAFLPAVPAEWHSMRMPVHAYPDSDYFLENYDDDPIYSPG